MAIVSIPTGSITLFRQPSAPVKWTKTTTYNDYTLRVTSGTIGTSSPSNTYTVSQINNISVSAGGSYTITGASVNPAPGGTGVPNHIHPLNPTSSPGYVAFNYYGPAGGSGPSIGYSYWGGYGGVASGATGGGVAHNHTSSGASFPLPIGPYGTTLGFSFSLKYIDVILCTRTG